MSLIFPAMLMIILYMVLVTALVGINEPIEIRVGESLIKNSNCEKLLGLKIYNKLNFDTHVKGLCKKANNKLRYLARATPYMSLEKKKLLMNFFFNAQFNYCPLIWMLHIRSNNNKTKNLKCLKRKMKRLFLQRSFIHKE